MPSVVHRLGELEHVCDKHNLKLKTIGYITLSSPQSFDYAFSSNFQHLDAVIASGTWITGANRLRLHVELLFDDIAVSGSSVSQVTEDIGVVLCNAELWSQLCLDASLTLNDSSKFLISLSPQSSSNADIRPPSWIPSTWIDEISMSFHFSTCRRTRYSLTVPVAVYGNGSQHTLTSPSSIDEHFDHYYHSSFSSSGGPRDTVVDRHAPWSSGILTVDTSALSSQHSVSSDTHSTLSLDTSASRHRYAIQEVSLEILIRLVDSSLRRMISDNKPVRCGGLVLSSDAGYLKLAAISPAFFSPGYVKAVSQRLALLPTIARTVSRVYRRANSNRLRQKLKRLHEVSLSSELDRSSSEDSRPSDISFLSSIEARLWLLMQSKLADPLACRGLKSLSTSSKIGYGSHEMLDESLDDAGDVMLIEDEAPIYDAYSDGMELDAAHHPDLFQEDSPDNIADDGEDLLDDNVYYDPRMCSPMTA